METHHLRRTARDYGKQRYWPLWFEAARMLGGAGIGIHDGGEWQLRVGSWELDMGRKVLLEEGRMDGKRRRRKEEFKGIILEKRGFFCRSSELCG